MAKSLRRDRNILIVIGVVCAVAIALNIVVRRAPVQDATAVSDLSDISSAVTNYATSRSVLPTSLNDISSDLTAATRGRLGNYDYSVLGLSSFQLCATFHAASNGSNGNIAVPMPASYYPNPAYHLAGHQCFVYNTGPTGIYAPQPQ